MHATHPEPGSAAPLTHEAPASTPHCPNRPALLEALARRVARLNRDAGEIGAGMLASLVDDARRALGEVTA